MKFFLTTKQTLLLEVNAQQILLFLNNTIHSSRSEGIFILDAGFSWIYNNEIHDNNDGIIMYDSWCHLNSNIMRNNLRAGLIICGSSFPKIENNELFGNTTSGMMIRGSSEAIISKNKIHENY